MRERLQQIVMFAEDAIEMRDVRGQRRYQAKIFKGESGGDRAADQRIRAKRTRCLPNASWHSRNVLPRTAKLMTNEFPRCRNVGKEVERFAAVEVPDLVRLDDVPAAELAGSEKVMNRRNR